MKKYIGAAAITVAIAAGCGSTKTVTKTVTVKAPPITNTVTQTQYKTPQSCKTALYTFRKIANLELNAIKAQQHFDYATATSNIKKATKMVNKVISPYTKCLVS